MYFDQLLDFLLLLFHFTLLLCHILLFGCWIRVSNNLNPDVGPDLSPNCLQTLSVDNKCHPLVGIEVKSKQLFDTTFWLKHWLNLIALAPTSFIWLKCWLQQILSQGLSPAC